jgi:hypothetical protein
MSYCRGLLEWARKNSTDCNHPGLAPLALQLTAAYE